MKTISIANQKGGVGKTTTAINLARSLALRGESALLVDLDPQGNAFLGVKGMSEGHEGKEFAFQICPGFQVLSIPAFFRRQSQSTPSSSMVKKVIDEYKRDQWVIFDCPPRVDAWGLIGLELSHFVIIPVQSEFFAMQGLTQALNHIEGIRCTRNPSLVVKGLLLTMIDWKEPLHNEVVSEIREHLSEKVFETEIPRDLTLAEAASHGEPVWDYDCSSPGALAYLQLAREVIGYEP